MKTLTCQHDKRTLQNREAKRRQRARGNMVSVSVELTLEEMEVLAECKSRCRTGSLGFLKKALLTGARFIANSGSGVRK